MVIIIMYFLIVSIFSVH
ncbi:hypothetical protein [Plasmodium yoelii yoelii]|uniref:Uncharacterized protein n=1 Tax=Plasmodium yoelii yoelii TaxID=73239 RepID=Q7RAJ1_PLAYO|nr:hypothetical protein [Plasmodium yoelii yoelii]